MSSFLSPPKAQLPAGVNMAPKSGSATGNPRNKTALKPGRSLMDWIRLGQSGQDLTGVNGQMQRVTPDELAKHKTVDDAWTAIRGRVYNLTAYMEFHPGGVEELMRAAGIDGTQLFDEVHRWVNLESMLAKCLVGKYLGPSSGEIARRKTLLRAASAASVNSKSSGSIPSTSSLRPPSGKPVPRFEWIQNDAHVTLVVYTKWRHMRRENVFIDKENSQFRATLRVDDHTFILHLDLSEATDHFEVNVRRPSGKVEIVLTKAEPGRQWATIGSDLSDHQKWTSTPDTVYRKWQLKDMVNVTHDSRLYTFEPPRGTWMRVPLGHHVHARTTIEGMEVCRSYTVVPPSLMDDGVESKDSLLHLMVKIYPHGTLSALFGRLSIGDEVELSNPEGKFQEEQDLEGVTSLVLCAAGTGFTPMAGLIRHCLTPQQQQSPFRKVCLVFFNKTEADILWRNQLDTLAAKDSRFDVRYVLSEPHKGWTGRTGRVRKDLVEEVLKAAQPDEGQMLFCACGPTAFTEEAIRLAKELGCERVHPFVG